MDKTLLLSEAALKKYTVVNDNIDGKYILPTILQVQETDLDAITGPILREKLEDLVSSGDIEEDEYSDYKTLLDKYVVPYMAAQTAAAVMLSVNYKITNSGVVQNQDDKKTAVSLSEGVALRKRYENVADAYACKLRNHLCANSSLYPEYHKMQDFQGSTDPQICGIVFD